MRDILLVPEARHRSLINGVPTIQAKATDDLARGSSLSEVLKTVMYRKLTMKANARAEGRGTDEGSRLWAVTESSSMGYIALCRFERSCSMRTRSGVLGFV